MNKTTRTLLSLAAPLALVGCTAELDGASEPQAVLVPEVDRIVDGFEHPESVLHDPQTGRWFVASLGEIQAPGDGFVSVLDSDGAISQLRLIEGLDDPKGMGLDGETLYVADLSAVVAFDLDTQVLTRIEVPGAIFLNDIAIDPRSGDLLVSDSFANQIFRISDGVPELLVADADLEAPNGLLVDAGILWVASIGPDIDPMTFEAREPGRLFQVDLDSLAITPFGERFGSLDGLAKVGDELLVSDTFAGVYRVNIEGGEAELIVDSESMELMGAADITFAAGPELLAIPELFGTQVTFVTLAGSTEAP